MRRGPEAEFRLRAFCASGVLAGCGTGVLAGCVAGFLLAVPPVFRRRRAHPLTVRAASFARRVGSKPGQALRPRRHPPLWWLVVRVDWSGPLHLQPSHASIAGHSTNFACNFPCDHFKPCIYSVGIATFSDLVESSPNRIACDIWGRPSCPPAPSTLVRCGAWCPAMSFYCRGCSICFPGPCPSGPIRIGYAHPDRLLSYPDVRYLSGCSLPIRMFVTYPDVMVFVGPRLPFLGRVRIRACC